MARDPVCIGCGQPTGPGPRLNRLPQMDRAIAATGGDARAIVRVGEAVHRPIVAAQRRQELARVGIPHAHHAILPARGDGLAVRGEVHGPDVLAVRFEHAQRIANHESAKTTKLYDRTVDAISLDEIERIVLPESKP